MPATKNRYLNLTAMAQATSVERGMLERMLARGIIESDAELKYRDYYSPLFLETRAVEILAKRVQLDHDRAFASSEDPLPGKVGPVIERSITPPPALIQR